MEFLTFMWLYLALTCSIIFVLLFGQTPAFTGTPVSFAHWLLTQAWVEVLECVTRRVFGERGLRRLDAAAECCCERPNPLLQLVYLGIMGGGYYLYWTYCFSLLPNPHASTLHMYTGTAAMCACLATFLAASLSNPGRVTHANVATYLAAHPPDGALFPDKVCTTCGFARPGRSKHCGVCGCCVARFDHHCGWINNCVGAANARLFLSFLAVHAALCAYGATFTPWLLAGEMRRLGLHEVVLYNAHTRERMPLMRHPGKVTEWLLVHHPVPLALEVFFIVAGILMASFLAYQLWLTTQGRTTYEVFKEREYVGTRQREADRLAALGAFAALDDAEEHSSAASGEAGAPPGPVGRLAAWAGLRRRGGKQGRRVQVLRPPNAYDRGPWLNLWEVVRPVQFLEQATARHGADAAVDAAAAAGGPRRRAGKAE